MSSLFPPSCYSGVASGSCRVSSPSHRRDALLNCQGPARLARDSGCVSNSQQEQVPPPRPALTHRHTRTLFCPSTRILTSQLQRSRNNVWFKGCAVEREGGSQFHAAGVLWKRGEMREKERSDSSDEHLLSWLSSRSNHR